MLKRVLIATTAMMMATSAWAADNNPCANVKGMKESGTFVSEGGSVGFLLGVDWIKGTVAMNDGRTFHFSTRGAKLLKTGIKSTRLEGTVYNLDNPEDFAGTYTGASTALTLVKPMTGEIVMNNSKCVVIKAKAAGGGGISLSPPGPEGVLIRLEK